MRAGAFAATTCPAVCGSGLAIASNGWGSSPSVSSAPSWLFGFLTGASRPRDGGGSPDSRWCASPFGGRVWRPRTDAGGRGPRYGQPHRVGDAPALSPVFLLVILSFPVSIAALVLRYRRSGGRDRAQLRWVAFSGALFVAVYVVVVTALSFIDDSLDLRHRLESVTQVAFAAFPIGIGLAVLRHDLYDIDVVINRGAGLRRADRDARRHVPRQRAAPAAAPRAVHPGIGPGRRGVDARHRRAGAPRTRHASRSLSTTVSSAAVRRNPHARAIRLAPA